MNELQACIEQKQVLLTKLRDLSQQIELQCDKSEHRDLADFVEKRQIYLDRLKKCTNRITVLTKKLPPHEQQRMNLILSAKLSKEQCNTEEIHLLDVEVNCRTLLQQISSYDANSRQKIKQECDRLRGLVNDSRNKNTCSIPYF